MTFAKRALSLAAATVAAGLLAAAPAAHASNRVSGPTVTGSATGRCAAITTKQVSGTLLGRDGLGLNATIGFDLLDSAGNKIDARTGCNTGGGYGAILQLNHYISSQGAPVGSQMVSKQGQNEGTVVSQWGLYNLPANVSKVYIETYTRNYNGSPCGLPCAGPTDNSKYGNVNRQRVALGNGLTNIQLVADTTKKFGGDTGSISVYVHSGSTNIHAWSMSVGKANSPKNEGWGTAVRTANPHLWTIPALSPGQNYTIIVQGYAQRYNIKVKANKVTKVTF